MEITRYTTQTLITMAKELKLDLHDCALSHILARHLYGLRDVTHVDGTPCDYKTIARHVLNNLK
ncbi:hypothetical protein [Xenorhabdus sp. PB30.3]|uniref:hypothetical protein n=1 Tax=Xenorhabdus sp. PB30.3 TaxID=2788941 RepID=UPI001E38F1F9|nr:hypothetical protein [Xenorhabdus sp. PB30.3]MCC8379107.1 hypothetical protein [Xenorhabdus sp. PB30.3]